MTFHQLLADPLFPFLMQAPVALMIVCVAALAGIVVRGVRDLVAWRRETKQPPSYVVRLNQHSEHSRPHLVAAE